MSYQLAARLFQTNTNAYFTVVEKTVWNYANGGRWSESAGAHIITIGGSGTSGTLRFASDNEVFLLALGVHNYGVWTDIVPDLKSSQTGVVIHPQYYEEGTPGSARREERLSEYKVTSSTGRPISVKCTAAGSNSLNCDVVIG